MHFHTGKHIHRQQHLHLNSSPEGGNLFVLPVKISGRDFHRIFHGLPFVFAYLDDNLIASRNLTEYLQQLQQIFTLLKDNGLVINLVKCTFAKSELEFLGHRARANGIIPQPKRSRLSRNSLPHRCQAAAALPGFYKLLQTIHSWPSEVTTTSQGRLDRQPKDVGLDTADAPVL
jgi:hypothetical protein